MPGDCAEAGEPQFAIEGVPLVPRKPGQCVLLADADLQTMGTGNLWMHNLYIRHKQHARDRYVSFMHTADGMVGQLWMTSCTLQGSGQYDSHDPDKSGAADGMFVYGSTYVEGMHSLVRTPPGLEALPLHTSVGASLLLFIIALFESR